MPCQNHPQIDEGLALCDGCHRPFCAGCLVALGGALRCGPCKTEWVLDRLSGVPTSRLDYASIWNRFLAVVIDGLVVGLPLIAVLVVLLVAQAKSGAASVALVAGIQVGSLLTIPLSIVYNGWMVAARGQTLGKMALRIGVVTPEGGKVPPGQAWARAVLQRIFLSCLSVLDVLPALLTPERTCIHDMAAKTRVINWPR